MTKQINQLLPTMLNAGEKNNSNLIALSANRNAVIAEFGKAYAQNLANLDKLRDYCKEPQKVQQFANSDKLGIDIPQICLSPILENLAGNGKEIRGAKLVGMIAEKGQDIALVEMIETMATVVSQAANKSYQIKDSVDTQQAAIECARLWYNEPDFAILTKQDIAAAFTFAAYGGEIEAFNALSLQFFCKVIKNYLKARELAKSIISAIQSQQSAQPLQLNSGENVKNEEARLGWWREFRDDVMNKTPKMQISEARKKILQKLNAAGIIQITPELKSQIYKDALLQIINEKIGERMSGAATSYERAKNRNCVLLLMDEFRKSYSDSLQMQTVFDICSKIAPNNEALQVAIKDMAGTDKQTADEANTAQLAITKLNLWYQHAVKSLDFNQLPQTIE